MANMKSIKIKSRCVMCGLCEQPEVSTVFTCEKGMLCVKNSGIIDIDKVPKVLEIAELCPVKAIDISNPDVDTNDKAAALDQFNKIINNDLRDYPFSPPVYYRDYAYETKKYQAMPVPAKYRSESKYLTDESAEDAGLAEFKRAVYSQHRAIAKQYLTAYRIRQLSKYYDYEETESNYYFHINSEISKLLNKAVLLASIVTDQQIELPGDFCKFNIVPDWQATSYARENLQKLEERNIDFSRSSNFHSIADHYRTWINTDGDFKHCFYDFSEAEAELRDDIDLALSDVMEEVVSGDVNYITTEYLKRAKKLLLDRIEVLQAEVKKFRNESDVNMFESRISALYDNIMKTTVPEIDAPYPIDYDEDYNDDYRFYSERDCIKAANNRRNRAYSEGRDFIKKIPQLTNEKYMHILAKQLTKWKREVLSVYDLCGREYPKKPIEVCVGSSKVTISFLTFEDVEDISDDSIRKFMEKEYQSDACYGSINGVSYISEYDCEIETNYDCDFKETFWGDIKEVNKRYAYYLGIGKFRSSIWEVSSACKSELDKSGFVEKYFSAIKQSFVTELQKII